MSLNEHDYLTNLPGSDALIDKLKSSEELNYILVNIDNFSNINNAYGFEVGNKVLQKVAEYLNLVKTNKAVLYRFRSDMFVILEEQTRRIEELENDVKAILSFFSTTDITISESIEFEELVLKISLKLK